MATTEACSAAKMCCIESFLLCLTVHAPNHNKADPLQHAAMHMRRVMRGVAMLHMKANAQVGIEAYCDQFLQKERASSFGVLSVMYYEIRRCVVHDKRLLIHRCDPDPEFASGSAVLVDTGKEMVRVTWAMMRNIVHQTLQDVSELLDSIELPGKVKVCYANICFYCVA